MTEILNFEKERLKRRVEFDLKQKKCSLWETLPCNWEVRGLCMCKEILGILFNRVEYPKIINGPKIIIGKNGWPSRRRGSRGRRPKKRLKNYVFDCCYSMHAHAICMCEIKLPLLFIVFLSSPREWGGLHTYEYCNTRCQGCQMVCFQTKNPN
jgi:hypothetical protein